MSLYRKIALPLAILSAVAVGATPSSARDAEEVSDAAATAQEDPVKPKAEASRDAEKAPEAADRPPNPATVAMAVEQLGSPAWRERRQAEARLKATSARVLEVIDPLLARTRDPEILHRLERVYRHHTPTSAYAGESQEPGFLGVQFSLVTPEEEPLLEGRHYGFAIEEIEADTAAERAGLQAGDLVVAVNDEPFLGAGSTEHLVQRIQRIGEGGQARIELYRGDQRQTITTELTARPPNLGGSRADAEARQRVLDYRWRLYWRSHCAKVRAAAGETDAAEPGASEEDTQESDSKTSGAADRNRHDGEKDNPDGAGANVRNTSGEEAE